jgi:hypothetical protein
MSFEHFRQLNGSSLVFAFADSHLMPCGTFSATLTTWAFDPSRLRWFAPCSCKPGARGQFISSLISYAAYCGTLISATQSWSRPVKIIPRARFGYTGKWCPESVVTTNLRRRRHSRLSSRISR